MDIKKFIESLIFELKKPLPGLESQLKMAPNRQNKNSIKLKNNKAGVLILLFIENNNLQIVLIKRKKNTGVHSGQISFPGGKMEKNDSSIKETALRETEEEIGINRQEITTLGNLSNIYIEASNFDVFPFIGYLHGELNFQSNPNEVEYIIKYNVHDLCCDKNKSTKIMNLNGKGIKVPYYNVNENHVWGATAMILSEFIDVLKNSKLFIF